MKKGVMIFIIAGLVRNEPLDMFSYLQWC